jgi:hypothetical protein
VTTLTRAKVALALIGLVLFGAGVRLERMELRWTGLAFVLAAWLLRFVKPRKPEESDTGTK